MLAKISRIVDAPVRFLSATIARGHLPETAESAPGQRARPRGVPLRHASEQNFTRSQSRAHFFRHTKSRPQTGQRFFGRSALAIIAILDLAIFDIALFDSTILDSMILDSMILDPAILDAARASMLRPCAGNGS